VPIAPITIAAPVNMPAPFSSFDDMESNFMLIDDTVSANDSSSFSKIDIRSEFMYCISFKFVESAMRLLFRLRSIIGSGSYRSGHGSGNRHDCHSLFYRAERQKQ
jgi:hypothetical protein